MDRSTPITHLRSHGEHDTEAVEMMDNIVNDIEEEDQPPMMQQPRMQQQQQQQQQQQHFPGHYGPMQPGMMHGNGPMMMPPHMMMPPPQMMQQPQRMPQQNSLENPPMSQRILSEAKEPLLVSVLVMIMSSGHLQSLIARFLPIASSNPLIGLAVRAILAGVLFYLLRRFIPSV